MRIHREGTRIIQIFGGLLSLVALVSWLFLPSWVGAPLTFCFVLILAFVIRFFRVPTRPLLSDDEAVFAPCDGTVVAIEEVYEGEYFKERRIQVSIFMSIWNVHINYFPVSGQVEYFKHHYGKFLVAWHPKSSEENERTTTVVGRGERAVLFRQIAGYVARRIVSYAKEGNQATQNTECGFIKFGSRVDLFLPIDAKICIGLNDKVAGTQTVIARFAPKKD